MSDNANVAARTPDLPVSLESLQAILGQASVSGVNGTLAANSWTTIPEQGADITAHDDFVGLLTVVPNAS